MLSMKAIKQRVFVKNGGGYKLVPFCGFTAICNGRLEIDTFDISDEDIPPEFDTIFPQDVFLVFQDSEHDEEFFDESRPGKMLKISVSNPEFRIRYYSD